VNFPTCNEILPYFNNVYKLLYVVQEMAYNGAGLQQRRLQLNKKGESMTYQKWLICNVVFGFSMAAQANCLNHSEKFTIAEGCDDFFACTQEVGPYSEGKASVGGNSYVANASESTCCQLASSIQVQVCGDGHDSKGVVVTCK
jgi:hypothetical protein